MGDITPAVSKRSVFSCIDNTTNQCYGFTVPSLFQDVGIVITTVATTPVCESASLCLTEPCLLPRELKPKTRRNQIHNINNNLVAQGQSDHDVVELAIYGFLLMVNSNIGPN